MRTFLALDVPQQVKAYAHEMMPYILQHNILDATIVQPELLHISILFLGEITDTQLEQICLLLDQVKRATMAISLGPITYSWEHNRGLLFLPVISHGLENFYIELVSLLSPIIFLSEREFWPHCTLARIKGLYDEETLKIILAKQAQEFRYQANEFLLFKSELTQEGPKYTVLQRWD